MVSIPRVVIAAPASGHGKTSVATGLLSALRGRGLAVSGHKVGPDYIDPGYHAIAAGRPGRNLDPWLVGEQRIEPLFVHGATTPAPADIAVVEGVMGLFDGMTGRGGFASTAHVAALLGAPVVLVVDATGMGRSVTALVHGFAAFDPSVRLGGVILNRVGSRRHRQILTDALAESGVAVLGAVPRHAALETPSRHLGLIPAAERTAEAGRTVAALGEVVGANVDLDAIVRLARTAAALDCGSDTAAERAGTPQPARPVRVAVAGGAAFSFGYTEQGELLAAAGAEVVPFDPLRDERLPADVDGLVIGGGFPEAHAATLSANEPMRAAVAELARRDVPIAAECAGLLYLARSLDRRPMCGVLDVDAAMTDRLTLGYRDAVAPHDSVLAPAGTRVHGHEFHRTACLPGAPARAAWQWRQDTGTVAEGVVRGNVHASYLHLHWAGNPGVADRFVAACVAARSAPA
ncbi:MAG: cobyrinic acid a,c-diamide synthase [Pseudonocardiales bacterium]|nr:MAG: cobyrinic acid a,c-diamide synthase [Pseudonocardiales bacterium]